MGALGTAFACSQGLDPSRVALVAPAVSPKQATETMGRLLWMSGNVVDNLQQRLEDRVGLALDDMEEGRLYDDVTCPTLVVHDRDDHDVSVDAAEAIAEATDARVRWTEGLGHRRILRDPAVVARVVSFIDEAPRPAADPWRSFLVDDTPIHLGSVVI
jgi:pimeloyl-ACP methyl ester carboxylesterase